MDHEQRLQLAYCLVRDSKDRGISASRLARKLYPGQMSSENRSPGMAPADGGTMGAETAHRNARCVQKVCQHNCLKHFLNTPSDLPVELTDQNFSTDRRCGDSPTNCTVSAEGVIVQLC